MHHRKVELGGWSHSELQCAEPVGFSSRWQNINYRSISITQFWYICRLGRWTLRRTPTPSGRACQQRASAPSAASWPCRRCCRYGPAGKGDDWLFCTQLANMCPESVLTLNIRKLYSCARKNSARDCALRNEYAPAAPASQRDNSCRWMCSVSAASGSHCTDGAPELHLRDAWHPRRYPILPGAGHGGGTARDLGRGAGRAAA